MFLNHPVEKPSKALCLVVATYYLRHHCKTQQLKDQLIENHCWSEGFTGRHPSSEIIITVNSFQIKYLAANLLHGKKQSVKFSNNRVACS